MRNGIAASRALVLLLSKGALVDSAAVRLEVVTALGFKKKLVLLIVAEGGDDSAALRGKALALVDYSEIRQKEDIAAGKAWRHSLPVEGWTTLRDACGDTKLVPLFRDPKKLWAATLPALDKQLDLMHTQNARRSVSGVHGPPPLSTPDAAARLEPPFPPLYSALYRMRSAPLLQSQCDVLLVAAPEGKCQAAYLFVALRNLCIRRQLDVRLLRQDPDTPVARAVASAHSVVFILTHQFFDEPLVKEAALETLKLGNRKVVLIHEQDYRHGGVERFDYFLYGREEVRVKGDDGKEVVRVTKIEPTPEEIKPIYWTSIAIEFERLGSKRAVMLHKIADKLGCVPLGNLGGTCPPPPKLALPPLAFSSSKVEAAVQQLLSIKASDHVVVASGLGGAGKSTLATSVAHHARVSAHFSDVLWVTLGAEASSAQLLSLIGKLITELVSMGGGSAASMPPSSLGEATEHLRALLFDHRILVIADDVLTQEQALAFLPAMDFAREMEIRVKRAEDKSQRAAERAAERSADAAARDEGEGALAAGAGARAQVAAAPEPKGSALLFTTRNPHIFPASVRDRLIKMGALSASESREFFFAHADLRSSAGDADGLNLAVDSISEAVGSLPLSLDIISACARKLLEQLCKLEHSEGSTSISAESEVLVSLVKKLSSAAPEAPMHADPEALMHAPAALQRRARAVAAETEGAAPARLAADATAAAATAAAAAAVAAEASEPRALLAGAEARDLTAERTRSEARELPATIIRTIYLSLTNLFSPPDARLFSALGLFAEDTAIDEAVIAVLWRMGDDALSVRALLERMRAAGLVKVLRTGSGDRVSVQLHDVTRLYARKNCAVSWQRHFLERLAERAQLPASSATRAWWCARDPIALGASAADAQRVDAAAASARADFIAEHLVFHLLDASLTEEAQALLFRLPWLQFVLRRRSLLSLFADVERVVRRLPPGASDARQLLQLFRLTQAQLSNARDSAADCELPAQIAACVGDDAPEKLRALREESREWVGERAWLKPLSPTFVGPGGQLEARIDLHGRIEQLVVLRPSVAEVAGASPRPHACIVTCTRASGDLSARVFSEAGVLRRELQHSAAITCLAALDESHVVSAAGSTVAVWSCVTGEKRAERRVVVSVGAQVQVRSLAVLPSDDPESGGRFIAVGLSDGKLFKWRVAPDSTGSFSAVEGLDHMDILIWNVKAATSNLMTSLAALPRHVGCVASGSAEHVCVWNLIKNGLYILHGGVHHGGHTDDVLCLAALTDGRLASGSGRKDCSVRIWHESGGTWASARPPLRRHNNSVLALAELSHGRLASSSHGSGAEAPNLVIWDTDTGACLRELRGHQQAVWCLTVTSDGSLISGSDDRTLRLWSVSATARVAAAPEPAAPRAASNAASLRVIEQHAGPVRRVEALPGGLVVSGSLDFSALILNPTEARSGEALRDHHKSSVTCIATLRGGRVVTGSLDATLRIWDIGKYASEPPRHNTRTLTPSTPPPCHPTPLTTATGRRTHFLPTYVGKDQVGHTDAINALAVFEEGDVDLIVSASSDSSVRKWAWDSSESSSSVELGGGLPDHGHSDQVKCMEKIDQRRVVTGSRDRTLRVWDVITGSCLVLARKGHTSWVRCVTVLDRTGDGAVRIMSGSKDGTACVWTVGDAPRPQRGGGQLLARREVAAAPLVLKGLHKKQAEGKTWTWGSDWVTSAFELPEGAAAAAGFPPKGRFVTVSNIKVGLYDAVGNVLNPPDGFEAGSPEATRLLEHQPREHQQRGRSGLAREVDLRWGRDWGLGDATPRLSARVNGHGVAVRFSHPISVADVVRAEDGRLIFVAGSTSGALHAFEFVPGKNACDASPTADSVDVSPRSDTEEDRH